MCVCGCACVSVCVCMHECVCVKLSLDRHCGPQGGEKVTFHRRECVPARPPGLGQAQLSRAGPGRGGVRSFLCKMGVTAAPAPRDAEPPQPGPQRPLRLADSAAGGRSGGP